MKSVVNRVPCSEFLRFIPHPVVIESLINKYPVVIEKVDGIAEKRLNLGKLIPKLQHLKMKEYGYHAGLLKNEKLVHTHVNPLIDQVPAPSKEDEERYQETYRRHNWPAVDGYKETSKDIFAVVHQLAIVMAQHLDKYVIKTLKPNAE